MIEVYILSQEYRKEEDLNKHLEIAKPTELSDAGRSVIIGLHVDGIVVHLNDAEPEPFR